MRARFTSLLVSIAIIIACATSVLAYWEPDGNLVSRAGESGTSEVLLGLLTDGVGGATALLSTSNWYAYAQRVDSEGNRLWDDSGIGIAYPAYGAQSAEDGAGGAFIVWQGSSSTIYAQRLDSSGQTLWGSGGVVVKSSEGNSPCVAADGGGGAIVAWADSRNGTSDIYAQRINAGGASLWTYNGIAVCTAPNSQDMPQIAADGLGGALVAWLDYRNASGYDLYAQRIDADGLTLWAPNGITASTAAGTRSNASLAAAGDGGAILMWQEQRPAVSSDIYGQRISATGQPLWTAQGRAVCDDPGNQYEPSLAKDHDGNALVAWRDYRDPTHSPYCQKLTPSGSLLWGEDGLPIPGVEEGYDVRIISDGNGGALVAWTTSGVPGEVGIGVQRVLPNGEMAWTDGGVSLRDFAESIYTSRIVTDGQGGALVAWLEHRTGLGTRVYAQRVDALGRVGMIAGEIHSVIDVPGDQGGKVYLSWDASPLDVNQDAAMSHYTLWRAIDPDRASQLVDDGAALLSRADDAVPSLATGTVLRDRTSYYWELVGVQEAYFLAGYAMTIPTLFDSTAICTDMHYFQVITHSTDPHTFWVSLPDSGYSVDNLAPTTPRDLAGDADFEQGGLLLTWAENLEADLDHYAVYRGPDPDFIPQSIDLVATTAEPSWFDEEWTIGSQAYYKVSAVDVHYNESGFAVLNPGVVTDADPSGAMPRFRLTQNHPNPFNPVTEIRVTVPQGVPASLRIYDAAGRLRRTLLDDAIGNPGELRVTWDGRDGAGQQLPGGVYFYQLIAGQYRATKKMTLLK